MQLLTNTIEKKEILYGGGFAYHQGESGNSVKKSLQGSMKNNPCREIWGSFHWQGKISEFENSGSGCAIIILLTVVILIHDLPLKDSSAVAASFDILKVFSW